MNIKQIILEEISDFKEGLGDRYAQKQFGIPDYETDFNNQWEREKKSRNINPENGKLVGVIDNANIYMNPTSLENFEKDVRALSDVDGNLYVAQLDGDFIHGTIFNLLKAKGLLKPEENDSDYYQTISWIRMGGSNTFRKSMGGTDYNNLPFLNLRNKQPFAFN